MTCTYSVIDHRETSLTLERAIAHFDPFYGAAIVPLPWVGVYLAAAQEMERAHDAE